MELWIRVLKPFGYWADHKIGEELKIQIKHLNTLIKNGYCEICVNNLGNNLPYDEVEPEYDEEWLFYV